MLTPVAELEPVSIGGVVVSRATLHNEEELRNLDVRVGDTVLVQRAGDVIPDILSVNLEKRPANAEEFVFPTECPVCHGKVVRYKGEVAWRCVNIALRKKSKALSILFPKQDLISAVWGKNGLKNSWK